jgi:hypothetical protein
LQVDSAERLTLLGDIVTYNHRAAIRKIVFTVLLYRHCDEFIIAWKDAVASRQGELEISIRGSR